MRPHSLIATIALLPFVAFGIGCHVTEHKNGDNENVRVATPFGGVSVKTNDSAQGNLGLTVYPGATRDKSDKHGDDGAADVNLSFGNFHLGVRAATYTSPDKPDAVLAFYRKDLARYGVVIQCQHNKPVGTPVRTAEGLTCDNDDKHKSFQFTDADTSENAKNELRAGSRQHQHIAAIEPKNGGTKIGLVMLDLPTGLTDHDDENQQ